MPPALDARILAPFSMAPLVRRHLVSVVPDTPDRGFREEQGGVEQRLIALRLAVADGERQVHLPSPMASKYPGTVARYCALGLKIAVLIPIPSPKVAITTTVKPGLLRSVLSAKRKSSPTPRFPSSSRKLVSSPEGASGSTTAR